MPEFVEDRDRQVVPRWRSFASAMSFGEVSPLHKRSAGIFDEKMLTAALADWQLQPGVSVASDLISAAFSIGCCGPAQDAALYVLANTNSTAAARALASHCLDDYERGPRESFVKLYQQPEFSQLSGAIHESRIRLNQNPINPVLWTNLALMYTTLGQSNKAERAMKVALGLAPDNRFVIRAACRLFLHQGDCERAHDVLLRAASLKHDPWLLAGEIAVSAVRRRSSPLVKRARSLLESADLSPFHLSELGGAMATLEARSGNAKKARRLCQASLAMPAENAIAQAAWLDRQVGGIVIPQYITSNMQSSEANAWSARTGGQWEVALSEAKKWQADQPFSSRPAIFGGYLALTLERFEEAIAIIDQGLMSNREDVALYNNLAFSLAHMGKIAEARIALKRGLEIHTGESAHKICLMATKGLIAYRSGTPDAGRLLYQQAVRLADQASRTDLSAIAKIYTAIEEMRLGTPEAKRLKKEGLDAVKVLDDSLRPIFIDKLSRVQFASGPLVQMVL